MTERIVLLNWITFRLILPLTLLGACVFRFNLFTAVYGIFFLLVPLARSPNAYTIRRHTGGLVWALTSMSGIFMLAQIAFQIALAARKPYGHEFPNCSVNDNITRQVGLYRLDGARFVHVARLILPDVIVFIVSAALSVMAVQIRRQNADAPSNADEPLRPHRDTRPGLLRLFVEIVILIFVASAGIISPSVISSVYFLCFLFMGTFWACLGNADKLFVQYVRYGLLCYCIAHLTVLFLYQLEFLQELVDSEGFPARLVGLLALIRIDCNEPRDLRYQRNHWYNFATPAIVIILYYLLANHVRQWKGFSVGRTARMQPRDDLESNDDLSSNVRQRIQNPFKQYRVLSSSNPNQRPVTYNAVHETVTIQPTSPHSQTSLHHYRIRMAIQSLARVIAKQSYIISLISMMAWSVIYHSWLTFVYLLLAIFLWLIPSSRSFCLKLSPVYTLYAEVLLIARFIFSLNIRDEFGAMEKRTVIDFDHIGFQWADNPVWDLAVQSLFTFFFWTTLRLFMRERRVIDVQDEHGVNLADVHGSMASEFSCPETHGWLTRIGRTVKIVMIKFWIVLCCAMLLVISMQGKVVIYRIVYMALLLCFAVMLQVSYRLWRRMLYVFWVAVIFYSMLVLLLIYTYQFRYFPEVWQNLTHLSPETLSDFGLERYDKNTYLIVGLLTPTAFLILCILQLHYFHKHFLHITSKQDGIYQFPSFQLENQPNDLAKPSGFAIRCLQFVYKWSHMILDFGWRLLEIHILKVCLFTILLAAVVDPSAINLIFILLVAISLMAYNGVSVVAQSSSTIAAVLVIVKMVYQLRMVKEEPFAANCSSVTSSNFNRTDNAWVGFRKVNDIAYELRVYISVILVVTLRAVIVTRHRFFAESAPANQQPKIGIVFPGITHKELDNGLVSCMQYFWNYGFYRFGLEICFVTMVCNMCTRLDIFSVMYGILLLIMFMMSRTTLAKIWGVYVVVLGLLLPIQYLLVLGIPRGLCITYPWDGAGSEQVFSPELVQWLYLPDAYYPPKAIILIGDFFQLLFACCQWRVFNLETVYASEPYEGGSNENIFKCGKYRRIYENPVPDFMTFTKSYLDVIKVFVFNYLYWITLAVVFVAGTSRVSLLCFFYLIGCFFFLWHGNEFFRKPIKVILRQWNIFLTGNVLIILIKVILQAVGCVHLPILRQNYCWVIQLFGVACLKFGKQIPSDSTVADATVSVQKALGSGLDKCTDNPEDAGLVLDAVVFVFLLLQKRIFSSWYFQWVVLEHKVQSALASRGAEYIKSQVIEQTRKQKEDEMKVMTKIRRKVDRIRERQRKFKGVDTLLPPPESVPIEVLGTPKDPSFEEHYQVSRSGDYYMFEDSDSDDEDVDILAPSRPPEEDNEPMGHATGPDPLQMLNYAVMNDNIKATVQDIRAVNDRSESERGSEFASPGQTRLSMLHLAQRRATISSERERARVSSAGGTDSHLSGGIPALHLSPVQSLSCLHDIEPSLPSRGSHPTSPHIPRSVSDTEAIVIRTKLNDIPDASRDSQFNLDHDAATTGWEKTFHVLVFTKMFLTRIVDGLNDKLNRVSRGFRFVADKLRVEKRHMKKDHVEKVEEMFARDAGLRSGSERDVKSVEEAMEALEKATLCKQALRTQKSELHLDLPDRAEEEFHSQHNVIMRFVIACYFALTARSELLSYFMIILLQMTSASVLSLPLPLMLFLWGTLSVPRPTRAFWVSVISYTMGVVIIKYIFQFQFIPATWSISSGNPVDPLYPPKILGVERANHYASFDLALLLVVFFHRSVLKSLGLWRSAREEEAETDSVAFEKADDDGQRAATSSNPPEILYTPDVESKDIVEYTGEKGQPGCWARWYAKGRHFFDHLTNYTGRLNTNVYSYLFLCDFICFVIVVSFYWAFGPDAGGGDNIKDYFEENRIPTAFLVILIMQFVLMILERALYLRKNLKGKLIFQMILVLTVHGVFFFYLPKETGRQFSKSYPVQLWYFVKCAYFLLSAYQIRSGYPTRILGNFLTYNYSYLNLYLFKCFILIPFLMELRNIMDWIWTDTSMSMAEWLKLEDIYANMFFLKCWRMAEKRYPTPRGTRYMTFWKYLIGGSLLLLFLVIIWFPLILFSLTNAVGETNSPLGCMVELNLGGFQPLYRVSARKVGTDLVPYTQERYSQLLAQFSELYGTRKLNKSEEVKQAQAFIHGYNPSDVWLVSLVSDSSNVWTISPPAERDLITYLNSSAEIDMYFRWTFSFAPRKGKVSQTIIGDSKAILDNITKIELRDMIDRTSNSSNPVRVNFLYPFFVKVPSNGVSKYVPALQPRDEPDRKRNVNFHNVTIQLKRQHFPQGENHAVELQWWTMQYPEANGSDPNQDPSAQRFVTLTAFIDKIFPQAWSVITGYGIVGLYISLVFVIGRLVRTWSSGQSYRTMFEDLPVVDRILHLCLDIFLVRENREYRLEEDLYARLIFLYRSPTTMFKWTKLKSH